MKNVILITIALFFSVSLFAAEEVGFVKIARGDVKVTRSGKDEKVTKMMKLFVGDKVSTADKALLTMFMKDGSLYTIPEKSILVLEKYTVNKDNTKRESSLALLAGKMRGVVTSVQSKEPNVVVKTPSAVAGIRGTDIYVEATTDKKNNNEQVTAVACLSGTCLAGSLTDQKATFNDIMDIFEKSAFAEKGDHGKANVEMAQVPTGSAVSVKKNMSLENILKSSKKVSEGLLNSIKNSTPATDKEQKEASTGHLAVDAKDSSTMKADIDSGKEDMVASFVQAEKAQELKATEIKQIIGSTRVTISVDLSPFIK